MTNIYDEQKKLVLARFNTLHPESKIHLGGRELTVKELIQHIEKQDEFGKNVVKAQIRMLKVLASV